MRGQGVGPGMSGLVCFVPFPSRACLCIVVLRVLHPGLEACQALELVPHADCKGRVVIEDGCGIQFFVGV